MDYRYYGVKFFIARKGKKVYCTKENFVEDYKLLPYEDDNDFRVPLGKVRTYTGKVRKARRYIKLAQLWKDYMSAKVYMKYVEFEE